MVTLIVKKLVLYQKNMLINSLKTKLIELPTQQSMNYEDLIIKIDEK